MDNVLKIGQRVKVTRIVTFSYEVNISDWLDNTDETEIKVNSFKEVELDLIGPSDIEDNYDDVEITDDYIETVEII